MFENLMVSQINFENYRQTTKIMKNYQACKELTVFEGAQQKN